MKLFITPPLTIRQTVHDPHLGRDLRLEISALEFEIAKRQLQPVYVSMTEYKFYECFDTKT
jgi:hypothetical protein